ncbi:MAG: hypothetical protein U0359_37640 [Byssovorax sp.]
MPTSTSRPAIILALAAALGAQSFYLGCGGGGGAAQTTAASTSATSTGDTTAGAGGASSTSTGAGGQGGSTATTTGAGGQGGGATTGAGGQGGSATSTLEALLLGDWKPVSMQQGQNPPEPAPSGSPYTIFHETGEVWIGCGTPPLGTWTLSLDAPPPAIAKIDVVFGGGNMVTWYVVTLDPTTFVFAEGGDFFTFTRDACP